jgi:hypothetical protein
MKLRRTMFVLLLILSGLVTILVFWLAVRIEQIYAELACTPLAEFEGYCEPQNAHPNPWILGLIVVVGTVVMASFGWLAWQEHQLVRRAAAAEPLTPAQPSIVEMQGIIVVRGQARGGGRPERPARPHPERPQPD